VIGKDSDGNEVARVELGNSGSPYATAQLVVTNPGEKIAEVVWTNSYAWVDTISRALFMVTSAPQDLLEFFEAAVEAGELGSEGRRPWMRSFHLEMMRRQLETAERFRRRGWTALACAFPDMAHSHADGCPWPGDWGTGPAAEDLADLILHWIDFLCE